MRVDSLIVLVIVLCSAPMVIAQPTVTASPQVESKAIRPTVGALLRNAQTLANEGKFEEALALVDQADAIPEKKHFETYSALRTRGSIAAKVRTPEMDTIAAQAFSGAVDFPMSREDRLKMLAAIGGLYYRAKKHGEAAIWAQRYERKGGMDTRVLAIGRGNTLPASKSPAGAFGF